MLPFKGNFTQQHSLPETALETVRVVLGSARLHRYNQIGAEVSEVAALEAEYAAWQGARYCVAVTSGGQAMQIALRSAGVKTGDKVLTNGFTLAPVPGAIQAVGGLAVLVEIDENLRIDLGDLESKITTHQARYLLLSHMRGHLVAMDKLMEICDTHGVCVIEDCAHSMGAMFQGVRSGNFGKAACFSTQTYKHINSGEGGLLCSNDPDLMARATIMSGSYMLYDRHGASPPAEYFDTIRWETPNLSARMDNLRAAILRPQLITLDQAVVQWNERHRILYQHLTGIKAIALPQNNNQELRVGSSFQFRVPEFNAKQCQALLSATSALGVELKWFGRDEPQGFTSDHHSWRYLAPSTLAQTDRVLATLFDMRVPLSFSHADCQHIAEIIAECVGKV